MEVASEEDKEPLERDTLPFLKDLNLKISVVTILKDNIGVKEFHKITMPVYFNDPTGYT
jgi:hypothetical protein